MAHYVIDERQSKLVVMARSKVHDTEMIWKGITGSIDAKVDGLDSAKSEISVDMTTGDAGDWVKNRKLRKELNFDKNPKASFSLRSVEKLEQSEQAVSAQLQGELRWRGKTITVDCKTQGKVTQTGIEVTGTFDIDMTDLGITPPKVLMIKIDDVVNCTITIVASA